MNEPLSYSYLRKLQHSERESMALAKLSEGFYNSLNDYILAMNEKINTDHNLMLIKEYENTRHVVDDIIKMRKNKIVLRAMQNSSINLEGMTSEEERFYRSLADSIKRFEAGLFEKKNDGIMGREGGRVDNKADNSEDINNMVATAVTEAMQNADSANAGASASGEPAITFKNIRILKDIPAYKGADGVTYGPYKRGEAARLPESEYEFLVKSNYGVIE